MEIQENRRQKMSERQNPGIIITVNPPVSSYHITNLTETKPIHSSKQQKSHITNNTKGAYTLR